MLETRKKINNYIYFDCNEYTTKYKNQTYYYKVEKGRRWWTNSNMSVIHDEKLEMAFERSYQKQLRSKKLERILNSL